MESPASFDLANERMDMADDWDRFRPGIEEGVALVEGRIGKGVELSGALPNPASDYAKPGLMAGNKASCVKIPR